MFSLYSGVEDLGIYQKRIRLLDARMTRTFTHQWHFHNHVEIQTHYFSIIITKRKKNKLNRFHGFLSLALHPFKIKQRYGCYFCRSQFSGSCFLGNVRATFWHPMMHRYDSISKESHISVLDGHSRMSIKSTVKVMQKKSFANSLYRVFIPMLLKETTDISWDHCHILQWI